MNNIKPVGHTTVKKLIRTSEIEYIKDQAYVIDHVKHCPHCCMYPCYRMADELRWKRIKSTEEWSQISMIDNALEVIDSDLQRLKGKVKIVYLSMGTDPFPYGYPEVEAMTKCIIQKLNDQGIKVIVLSKGILPIELADMSPENMYGISLVSMKESFREKMEPGASPFKDRLAALLALKKRGARCWISMEPFPVDVSDEELYELLNEIKWVDRLVFGRWNKNKNFNRSKYREYYAEKALKVIEFCKEHNIECHIKDGTLPVGYPFKGNSPSMIDVPLNNNTSMENQLFLPLKEMVRIVKPVPLKEMVKVVKK